MHTWTETPLKEIWHQLRYLNSPTNLLNLLSGRTSSSRKAPWSENDDLRLRAYEIACCIQQADEYFHASQEVGLATKPLLHFYGSQALAKAVVLANDSKVRLHDLRYHGLSSRPSTAGVCDKYVLQKYSDEPTHWTIEEEFAVINDGVFPHLSKYR
jgi:hypothetical protein